jgi:hypothetical protein
MNKIENASCVVYDDDAPEFMVHIMYAMLNEENKEKINLLIEQLIAEQS